MVSTRSKSSHRRFNKNLFFPTALFCSLQVQRWIMREQPHHLLKGKSTPTQNSEERQQLEIYYGNRGSGCEHVTMSQSNHHCGWKHAARCYHSLRPIPLRCVHHCSMSLCSYRRDWFKFRHFVELYNLHSCFCYLTQLFPPFFSVNLCLNLCCYTRISNKILTSSLFYCRCLLAAVLHAHSFAFMTAVRR